MCRIHQDGKAFNDVLAFRIPVHGDKHGSQLNCSAMVEAERSALKSAKTIPILDLRFIFLRGAAQWMLAHPEVHQCLQEVDAPNFVSRFLGRTDGPQGPTTVLLRNCDNRLFFVTNADVSTGTAACGPAHIPDCATAALNHGPEALGYASGLWTAGRVRELIEAQCGVRYHEAHVWRILRQLGWSCQRPTGRALERDEEAIRYWKRVALWPRIKKKRSARDRSGISCLSQWRLISQ